MTVLAITIAQPTVIPTTWTGAEIASTWSALFAALIAGRLLVRAIDRRTSPIERCLVIGDRRKADRIRERLSGTSQGGRRWCSADRGEHHAELWSSWREHLVRTR